MVFFFFFNDTATTEIYTLSLHDALPISAVRVKSSARPAAGPLERVSPRERISVSTRPRSRSEEHTSELQSQSNLVCRLLLEKKNNYLIDPTPSPGARSPRPSHTTHPALD